MIDADLILSGIGVLAVTSVLYFAVSLYQHRARIDRLRKAGWPMPKGWSWLTGHMFVLLHYAKSFPPLVQVAIVAQKMLLDFPEDEMFLLDLWPSFHPTIMCANPEALLLTTQKWNWPKTPHLQNALTPITGGPSLLTQNGKDWKLWRSRFNPGFSERSLVDHVPFIVDRVQVFCDKLREKAGKELFSLDDFATRLTFEVVMKVSLDADINYQREEHVLATSLNTITAWHSFWDPRVLMNPLRPIIQRYHGNIIRKYIRNELEQRWQEVKAEKLGLSTSAPKSKPVKSVIALAIESYISESPDEAAVLQQPRLDDTFADGVSHQIRLFLFAGNDTTASSISYVFHCLAKFPETRLLLRQEHDAIFGPNISDAATLLKQQPALLNQCRYTLAVIKETLRIYPPTAAMRQSIPGSTITTARGTVLPSEDLYIITNTWATHLNPRVWVRPTEFLPERWLVGPEHELYPPTGGFRPFDIGPRACIGQGLSLSEMRVVLVMTARSFELRGAYEEWDLLQEGKKSWVERGWERVVGKEVDRVNGERAYQTDHAGTHPCAGYPCRVEVVE